MANKSGPLMRLARVFSSIEFILVCMALALVLIFFGTIAQVDLGTFIAQKKFFDSWFIDAAAFGRRFPIFPGGLTVGVLWFCGLTAALVTRFDFWRRNPGLLLSHLGMMLLLLGQFLTQTFAHESQMAIPVGATSNYVEDTRSAELAVIDHSDPAKDHVVSIPASILSRRATIETPLLPFTMKVLKFFPNAEMAMAAAPDAAAATQGIGARVAVTEVAPVTSDDETNAATTVVEIFDGGRSLGTWLVSMGLGAPQSVHAGGKDFELRMRPRRRILPFALTLLEFHHDIYPGTDIPKNFSSLVRLVNPQTNEDRPVKIFMNHPLRYSGQTFYQASFGEGDQLSVLQVVQNPAWLTPYLSCALVAGGLLIYFLAKLSSFIRRRDPA